MTRHRTPRVLLIGWDAADWKVIHPLMDAGKLPALERFVNHGAMASLATLHPVLSPMLWTSIATGKRPYKHGILGFTEPVPNGGGIRPVTNLSRKVKAIWNILNQNSYRSIVVGWWPSNPVEPINGVMVSDHYHRAVGPQDRPWPLPPGTVHPPQLAATLTELRLHPNELVGEQILPFIPQAAHIDQARDTRLATVARTLAECTSIHAAATWLMEHEPWDFMAVYYDAIDHFCHGFMRYHPPRRDFIPEKDYALYHGVVEAGYRYHDLMLARLLELAGEDTTVILVSDHGFHADHLRPRAIPHEPAGPAVEHRDFGIFLMQGPGIKQDEYVHSATLLDITPTILTCFGLPIGADMDGRPLLEVFEAPPEVDTIASWEEVCGEDGRHPSDMQLDPVASQEALQQLVALGYIEQPEPNHQRATARTVRELRYNLARSYMDGDHHGEAVPILQELYEQDPWEYRFGIQLAMCYRALDRFPEMRTLVETLNVHRREEADAARQQLRELRAEFKRRRQAREVAAVGTETTTADGVFTEQERRKLRRLRAAANVSPFGLEYLLGFVDLAEGRYEDALAHLRRAERSDPERPGLHLQIGEAYLKLKRWQDAERAFAKAAEIDPDSPHAHLGLARSHLARRRNRRAAEAALTTVGLLYHYPMAHFCLGLALQRLGQLPRAVQALQVAVALNPNFLEAHQRLARLYERRLNDPEKAAEHRRVLAEIRATRQGHTPSPTPDASLTAGVPAATVPAAVSSALAAPINVRPAAGATARVGVSLLGSDNHTQSITVVTGLPRSGTSMIMKMLADGGMSVLADGVRTADADNPLGYFEYEAAKRLRTDGSWLGAAVGKAVKIVAQLVPYLPDHYAYRVIFIERDLREVLASQQVMLQRQGRQGARLTSAQLQATFETQLHQVKHGLTARAHVETLFVCHADILADPAAGAAMLNQFVGGYLDTVAMSQAVDTTLHRQRVMQA